jgi:hypothetical protein
MLAGNIEVPLEETTYQKFCFYAEDLFQGYDSEVYAVAMQYVSQESNMLFA